MANKQRDLAKESRWREILKRHAASELSVRAFCQQEQVTEPTFYAWRRTIGERDGKAKSQPVRNGLAKQPAFLPLVVDSIHRPDSGIVIELSGGRVLRLPESTSANRLAELVHALETRAEQ